mmetsp:Transcript_36755/g.73655  ORF Transcript_36755/g.73655 Transcript_36755/m.73655 type:complete len:311 (-) Transcript_36755:90-1022(-)
MNLVRGEHVNVQQDLQTIAIGVVGFLAVRWVFLTLFWEPFSKYVLVWKPPSQRKGLSLEELKKEEMKDADVVKMCKYGWHMLAYVLLWIWGFNIMLDKNWSILRAKSVDPCWVGYPHSGDEKPSLKPFFFAQISWYCQTFIESAMVDKARGDFWMMMIHHVLAVLLLTGAYWGNAHRVAVTVVFEQDLSDILMYFSKMLVKAENRFPALKSDALHGALLVMLIVAWWSTRCILLGFIVWSGYTTVWPTGLIVPGSGDMDGLSTFLILQLSVFFVLQVIWGCALIQVAVRKLTSGELHDHYGDADKKRKKN